MISIRHIATTVLIFVCQVVFVAAQRLDWIRARNINQWENVLRMAGNSGMGIFVQVCSEWSQICQNMNQVVLRDRTLIRELNKQFIPVQIDGDSEFGQLWIRHYNLPGYPVHLFMSAGEDLLLRLDGAQDREAMANAAQKAAKRLMLYPQLQSAYVAGGLSAKGFNELLLIEVDNHGVEASRPIFDDYVRKFDQALLSDTAGLMWISVFGLDLSDPLFARVRNKWNLLDTSLFDRQSFYEASLNASLRRAVRDSSEEVVDMLIEQLVPLVATDNNQARKTGLQIRKLYYFDTNQPEKFFETLMTELKDSSAQSRREALVATANELLEARNTPEWGQIAARIMREVIGIKDDMNARIGLAGALTLAREYDQAIVQLNLARQMTNDREFRSEIDAMIQRVRIIQSQSTTE
ncbi:hypothetical protein AT05_03910 [Schleiferia thermophila str. Yellowstone]|jgi:hypothetical protein|uniref:thioredoxin family protein n=1 Tax=Schleiferia thermophila TaxID=884107 RepID=UPI0004E65227|nr:thioredoxin family protein [Schleiferia thermophila]KFD39855.1 hypothetical protein AT05_03910 [Schleiferia thermophila str. Yellowstone]PMB29474.1 hypothetical protein CEN47_13030 [Fischerella thermalis CCMEE 5319]